MERELYNAIEKGRIREAEEILRDNPTIDVNWADGWSLLRVACRFERDSIVALLLTHPDIDVNLASRDEWTPFYTACYNGHTRCVRLLLNDPRVRVNEAINGFTPLWEVAENGFIDIVRWWIASGREMDFGVFGDRKTDVLGVARKKNSMQVVPLLERAKNNLEKTRYELRLELGFDDQVAAEVFALMVFVSDGLLAIRGEDKAVRFFAIATQLPLELQMELCHRLVGSCKEFVPVGNSEMAFKRLASMI